MDYVAWWCVVGALQVRAVTARAALVREGDIPLGVFAALNGCGQRWQGKVEQGEQEGRSSSGGHSASSVTAVFKASPCLFGRVRTFFSRCNVVHVLIQFCRASACSCLGFVACGAFKRCIIAPVSPVGACGILPWTYPVATLNYVLPIMN